MVFATSTAANGNPQAPPPTPGSSDLSAAPKDVLKDAEGEVMQAVPKQPLPTPSGKTALPEAAAQVHAEGVKKVFTPGDSVGTLVVDSTFPIGEGATARLRQEIDSVPVFGASVSQSLGTDGSLLAATGSLTRKAEGKFRTKTPSGQVSATAVKTIAQQAKVPADQLSATETKAYWYDAKLAGKETAKSVAVPAFKVEVKGDGKDGDPGHWTVFVDANNTGKVLDSWSEVKHLNRVVCDNANRQINPNQAACGSSVRPTRWEGRPPVGIQEVDNAYDYIGNTDRFYATYTGLKDMTALIGTSSSDGHGKALRATVRLCAPGQCPYRNAFWTGSYAAFGTGAATEDIVGHEFTHGVTQHTSGLVYRNEPGAINESMSDVFGEFTFLKDTANPCNTAANRWKLGACSSLGVIRNMQNPNAHSDPDTYRGRYWYTGSGDNGGVHINSGVNNKAASLMVDGGTHNGVTVTGIGIDKTAAVYWTTQTMLTSNSGYARLGSALSAACNANVQNRVGGLTAADCDQVRNAVRAVKMPVPASAS
ncbi:M4 family metallopeptidase [Nocardia sp. CDC159]|uniref:Neutral metalloproteinase n=1 Tax=Nocardia pulmonis TaxID=2951408 RepID=A0A9X2E0K0_9NOCA|nr:MULTISPECIES: M4 family metallopeptidase [Nocardia]MCM6771957.1 M4 family metallopeptidase [Nocardia pulmonis]MCM6785385.1 M4 family metallopeptidase [Nocardia sp. CDC159]